MTKTESNDRPMESPELMDQTSQSVGELKARLAAAMEKARLAAEKLEEKTIEAAKATDRCIRDHPYQTIGVAFGLGLLIGVLAGRRGDR